MTIRNANLIALAALLCATACGEQPETRQSQMSPAACDILEHTIPASKEDVRLSALTAENGLPTNGLNLNSLGENGLPSNGLALNALTENSLGNNGITFNGITLNSLTYNSLGYNSLTYNGVSLNGMNKNGIGENALSANSLGNNGQQVQGLGRQGLEAALIDSEDGRQFLKYAAGCMLSPEQSITGTSSDGEQYTFTGSLALAPDWVDRGLDETERGWLSACMLAHVNAFGITVPISARGADQIEVVDGEEEAYPVYEGGFFGDLEQGKYYACQGQDTETALASSAYRRTRVCTDSDDRCAIEAVGFCEDVCDTLIPGRGYLNCRAGGELYPAVVSVFLHDDAGFHECGVE